MYHVLYKSYLMLPKQGLRAVIQRLRAAGQKASEWRTLWHATPGSAVDSIKKSGLLPKVSGDYGPHATSSPLVFVAPKGQAEWYGREILSKPKMVRVRARIQDLQHPPVGESWKSEKVLFRRVDPQQLQIRDPRKKLRWSPYTLNTHQQSWEDAENALARGDIKRRPCRSCGTPHAEMHHPDRRKTTKVTWLCKSCHKTLSLKGK